MEELGPVETAGPSLVTVRQNGEVVERLQATAGSVEQVAIDLERAGQTVIELGS